MGDRSMPWLSMMRHSIVVPWCFSLAFAPAESVIDSGDVNVLQKSQQVWGGNTLLWNGASDPCLDSWPGVICNSINTIVTSLYLLYGGLVGAIPPELGSLSALENLDLSFNGGLSGQLPTELGSLSNLVYLNVQSCYILGPIPASLGNLCFE